MRIRLRAGPWGGVLTYILGFILAPRVSAEALENILGRAHRAYNRRLWSAAALRRDIFFCGVWIFGNMSGERSPRAVGVPLGLTALGLYLHPSLYYRGLVPVGGF